MNFRFYRISLYWVSWCSCHEGVLMSDEDENIMNVGCYSIVRQCCLALHCLSSESSPQRLTAILWLISLGWSSWLQGSSSHSGSMLFFIVHTYIRYKWTILTTETKNTNQDINENISVLWYWYIDCDISILKLQHVKHFLLNQGWYCYPNILLLD